MFELGTMCGWSPTDFWNATPIELHHALRGVLRKNGTDPDEASQQHEGITRAEVNDLLERIKK